LDVREKLQEAARTGLDMSPGDPVAAWAEARIAKLEMALGNLVRFDRGDAAIARGNYQNLMAEACEALGGDWKP
jgi:hypothetical protein